MTDRFDDVVRNAFDFLDRSIEELAQRPKYSVINFYSAIELFVKARLLKEHWSLIVAKLEQADRAKFQRGDFQSVGLKDANERLVKVVGDGLYEDELKCFDGLRQERNQMVHFAHVAQGNDEAAKRELDRIVAEHAAGWLYLRRLLTGRWADHFDTYKEAIESLNERMWNQTKSLEHKFLLLSDELKAAQLAGIHFMLCPSCRFKSFEVGEPAWVGIGKCRTCGFSNTVVTLKCANEDCEKIILITGSYEQCPECGHEYTPKDIEGVLEESGDLTSGDSSDPGDISCASCGNCDGYETVIPLANGKWFCTDCFDLEDYVGQCEWCTDHSTHLPDDSFLEGCVLCDGRLGNIDDD